MILAIDVGNTETVIGVFRGLEPLYCWRIATRRDRTGDEYTVLLQGFLDRALAPAHGPVRRAILASVVPVLDRAWAQACRGLASEFRVLGPSDRLPVRLDVDAPHEVGADRIANTLAASELYHRNTVVVDLGTATTFDCITADGVFMGGVIAPGPRAGIERLTSVATQLPLVEIAPPERVIGRRTLACVQSGAFFAIVDSIDGIVRRILEEWAPENPLVLATGGLAELIGPHCRMVDRVEPVLTLIGLAVADRHLGREGSGGESED
ncbi:MAG: type III pantothenate kinase [Gemmatimonadota bacterium]